MNRTHRVERRAGGRVRAASIASAIAVLALLATGCAQAGPDSPPSAPGRNPEAPPLVGPGTGAESPAIGLVGLWRVSGVAEEQPDTWLRVDAPEFQLCRDCGMIQGSWQATDRLFLASTYAPSGDCVAGTIQRVRWLEAVTGYRAADFYTKPPQVTDSIRAALGQSAPFPTTLAPVTAAELTGRWIPVAYAVSTDPHEVFHEDGSWTASDGCNGGQGRFDSEWLLLLNSGGSEIARLQRG
jgi:hypothetical protein